MEDEANSVYSGLIRLRPTAVRANATQTNRNLVLSEGAKANSIPNLEIECDDVRCSHASAIGPRRSVWSFCRGRSRSSPASPGARCS